MSSVMTKLRSIFSNKRRPISIMLVGLDNSGKTTLLNQLSSPLSKQSNKCHQSSPIANSQLIDYGQSGMSFGIEDSSDPLHGNDSMMARNETKLEINSNQPSEPTAGYNYKRIQYKNLPITVLDFSGQTKYRNLWQEFYSSVDGIVFVVDTSDQIRFVVAKDELESLLSHPYFQSLAIGLNRARLSGAAASQHLSSSSLAPKQVTVSQGKLVQEPLALMVQQDKINLNKNTLQLTRKKVPILVLANKTDLPNSVDTNVIIEALELNQLPSSRHPWSCKSISANSGKGITEAFDWMADQLTNFS